jgi:hypothetical protein
MSDTPTFANFNPTNDPRVDKIKKATDDLIEMVRENANLAYSVEAQRRAAIAITIYEQAAMWAVKACFS